MNFAESLESVIILPIWHSVLLRGPHGRGKTECIRLAAKMLNAGYHDERLSLAPDAGDLKGLPFFVNGRTTYAPPEWYPMNAEDAEQLKEELNLDKAVFGIPGEIGYLAFEEIDRANRQVQQASFQIALDRMLGRRKLRPGWRVVSCINGDGDIYHTLDMDPAFIDRWVFIEFNPSVEEWIDNARGKSNIPDRDYSKMDPQWLVGLEEKYKGKSHPAVLEFITRFPQLLDAKKDAIEEHPYSKHPSRRSWTRFSEAIYVVDEFREKGLTDRNLLGRTEDDIAYLLAVSAAYVGETAAAQFASFVKTDYQSLGADAILNKWSDEVKNRLIKMAAEDDNFELAQYNKIVIQYIEDNKIGELNPVQSANLVKYIEVLPKEIRSNFWKNFASTAKEPALKWYRGAHSKEIAKLFLDAMVNPEARKKKQTA